MRYFNSVLFLLLLLHSANFSTQVIDVEGKKYKSGKFGSQVWMLENLNVSKFRNGDLIKEVKSEVEWDLATKNSEPVWCYYENRVVQNDPVNGCLYGKLYNWHAINDPRGLAPKGWHIPSFDDWTVLFNFVGGVKTAAYKLKSKDGWEPLKDWDYDLKQSYLIKGFTGGLNYQGFNALPAGWIGHLTGFNGTKGWIGKWWSTTANYSLPDNYSKYYMINDGIYYWESQYDLCYKDQIIIIEMIHRTDEVEIASQCKLDGYSVRCVKD